MPWDYGPAFFYILCLVPLSIYVQFPHILTGKSWQTQCSLASTPVGGGPGIFDNASEPLESVKPFNDARASLATE